MQEATIRIACFANSGRRCRSHWSLGPRTGLHEAGIGGKAAAPTSVFRGAARAGSRGEPGRGHRGEPRGLEGERGAAGHMLEAEAREGASPAGFCPRRWTSGADATAGAGDPWMG